MSDPPPDLTGLPRSGDVVAGRYKVEGVLGTGPLHRFAGALTLALLVAAAPAGAQPEDARARALELFQQGRAAVEAGDWSRSMPLFLESQKAFPSKGTLFNIALCEEQTGKLASALQRFKGLIPEFSPDEERFRMARDHAAALELRVPRLRVDLAPGAPPRTAVTLDGEALNAARLGGELRLDPGEHVVIVTAPGVAERRYPISLAEGAREHLRVEPTRPPVEKRAPIEKRAPAAPPAAASPPPEPSSSNQRTVGFLVGGVGLAALGVSGVTGLLAVGKKNDLDEACPVPSQCTPAGQSLAEDGETLTTASTVTFFIGLAAAGAGTVLVLTSDDGSKKAALAPTPMPGGGGLLLRGVF